MRFSYRKRRCAKKYLKYSDLNPFSKSDIYSGRTSDLKSQDLHPYLSHIEGLLLKLFSLWQLLENLKYVND